MTKNSKAVLIIATIIIALIAITAFIHAGFNRSYALAEGEEASEDFFGSVGVYYEGEDETPRYGDEKIELRAYAPANRSEEHTSELQSLLNPDLVCRLLLGPDRKSVV